MSLATLEGISTIFVMIAFLSICWWAFSPSRKKKFEEAANLPFADEFQTNDQQKKNLHNKKNDEEEQG